MKARFMLSIMCGALVAGCTLDQATELAQSNIHPEIDAAATRSADPGGYVHLDATLVGDVAGLGDGLSSIQWRQIYGPSVPIENATTLNAGFIAPDVSGEQSLMFEVTAITPSGAVVSDEVDVVIHASSSGGHSPTANAGNSQTVQSGARVSLDGAASADADGDALSFAWVQIDGPSVALDYPNEAIVSFTAPIVSTLTRLRFQLTVADPSASSTQDEVSIFVQP